MLSDLVSSTLLEWINSFNLGTTIRSIDQLNDGPILWDTLQDIDPQYFLGELPERSPSDHWVPRWQNLKYIHKALIGYIRNQNEGEVPSGLNISPDLKAIAEASSTKETNELLKLFLLAAISSPNAETYITTMQKLSTSTQEGLKDIIQEAQNPSDERLEELDYERNYNSTRRDLPMDPELRFEERFGKVLAEKNKLSDEKQELEKTVEDLHNRLAQLQESHDMVLDRLTSTEDRLAILKSGKADLIPNAKTLESRTQQQEDLIASQEAKIQSSQDEIDNLRMTVESLRVKNQRFQKLQDDYDEVKNERDQLSRRANAAEKYRQKLQASHDFEKENIALKNQVKNLQQQLRDSDISQKSSSERDVELEEYRRVLPRIEQDRHEIQNVKKQLEFNNHALTERLQSAEDQIARDEATISELRDRIRELEGLESPITPGSTTPKVHGTFQRDLDEVGRREAQLKIENEGPRRELERFNGEMSHSTGLGVAKFSENDAYQKLQDEYSAVRKKLTDAENELEETDRQFRDAKSELGSISNDKLDMVDAANDSSPPEIIKMREGVQSLRNRIEELETKLSASQTFVKEVSAERDSLRDMITKKEQEMQGEDQATMDEMKRLLEEVTVRINSTSDGPQLSGTELLRQFVETAERSAENLAKRAEHINRQNELIKSLQERIEHLEEQGSSFESQKNLMQIIQRQAREIALISSAWYDQQSRLQHANFSMQRYRHPASTSTPGAEVHRSWLAKQRALVARGNER
ncbi:M protein repeat protein [Paracoccidioides lutzii Pb01]|uniref:M protein repeat protein n=1 Tax=Paracoccidioides lutzii (strain ATCC MYA-826 / Pb01) TaxID=502779 RepID=C1HB73_PARBA|nr:M protein repeat protein [Paracoccidioides lutzii Pb01]EEH37596.2 M protein repeat protein [Paracoccidioides lutzii Pb01]